MSVKVSHTGDTTGVVSHTPTGVCASGASPRCPLTPALRRLLQACVDHASTDTDVLAAALFLSPGTVYSSFKRISNVLDTRCRGGAVILALKYGWVVLPAPLAGDEAERQEK